MGILTGLRQTLSVLSSPSLPKVDLVFRLVSRPGSGECVWTATECGHRLTIMSDYPGAPFMWTVEDATDNRLVMFRNGSGYRDAEHARAGLVEWLNSPEGRAMVGKFQWNGSPIDVV